MIHQLACRSNSLFTVPIFLAPAFSTSYCCSPRSFSTSPPVNKQVQRGTRDMNRKRGVSAIRRTGPRHTLSVTKLGPLPKPVSDPSEARAQVTVDPNHGLWGFFNKEKEALIPPSEEDSYGRSWTTEELSKKSWQDLHRLYWVCIKEANIVKTRNNERDRLKIGYGVSEGDGRMQTLSTTMRNIRKTLVDRHYARFDAAQLLEQKHIYEVFPDMLYRYVDAEAPELLESEIDQQDDLSAPNAAQNPISETPSSPLLSHKESSSNQ